MRLSKLALLMMSTTLIGCGGSSSSDPVIDQPDPQPEPPTILTFVIEGVATDAPIAGGTVTAEINGQQYSTEADDQGVYSLEIEYEEGSLDGSEMVTLGVTGTGDQEHVELVSQMGTIGGLQQQAGEDGTLDSSESSRTTITQITTAQYLLAQETGVDIVDDESLAEAEAAVNADELLEVSALIKLMADDPDFTPEGEETILDILDDADSTLDDAVEGFLEEQGYIDENGDTTEEFEQALDQAVEDTINDPAITSGFTSEEILGFNVHTYPVTNGWVAGNGTAIDIEPDGGAWLSSNEYGVLANDGHAQWQINDNGQLVLTEFSDGVAWVGYVGYDFAGFAAQWGDEAAEALAEQWSDGGWRQFQQTYTVTERTFTKLIDGAVATVSVAEVTEVALSFEYSGLEWDGEPLTFEESGAWAQKWHSASNITSTFAEAPSGTWALPLSAINAYGEGEVQQATKVTLADDNSVVDAAGTVIGQWAFEDGQLIINTDSGWRYSYLPFASAAPLHGTLISAVNAETEMRRSSVDWIAQYGEQTLADDLVQEMPIILGAWINAWMADGSDADMPEIDYVYGYSMNEDGTGSWINVGWDSFDYSGEAEPFFYSDIEWQWQHDNGMYMLSADNSYRSRTRTWDTIASTEDGRHFVLESEVQQYEGQEPVAYILPRINVLETIDISKYEKAYQRSLELGSIDAPALEYRFATEQYQGQTVWFWDAGNGEPMDCESGYLPEPMTFNNDGSGQIALACEDEGTIIEFEWAFDDSEQVISLTFSNAEFESAYLVAGPKDDDSQLACWSNEATSVEEAKNQCVNYDVELFYQNPTL